jgi:diphosphomevalonate decarboxylase
MPENPSLSLTLNESRTITSVEYKFSDKAKLSWEFFFDGNRAPGFEPKLQTFFDSISEFLPFLDNLNLKIESSNTFPHSTGIASSASALSALSLCILDIANLIANYEDDPQIFLRKASFIARIGSGSASRSLFPAYSVWGKSESISNSSDEYAIPLSIPENSFFMGLKDAVLIVSSDKKEVSSTLGHGLMNTNPYATLRYQHARENLDLLITAIKKEDKDEFIKITENEALTLHGLMMSSQPGFILLKEGSIEIIRKVRDFRKETGIFICFTLDAGPNIHLLYHADNQEAVKEFINTELQDYTEQRMIIWDGKGNGPEKLSVQ